MLIQYSNFSVTNEISCQTKHFDRLLTACPLQPSLTRVFVHPLLHRVVLLMDPFAVALKINLCGGRCLAVEIDRFILHNVAFLGFEQEVR